MSTDNPDILSVTLSELQPLNDNNSIDVNSLFFVECEQPPDTPQDKKIETGYQSSKMPYFVFLRMLKNEFRLAKINADLETMEGSLEVPSSLVVLENGVPTRRFVLSAISENTRASINGVSCYNMTEAVKHIFKEITLPRLSATDSPWLLLSQIKNDIGTSTTDAASQKLVTGISSELSSIFPKYIQDGVDENSDVSAVSQSVLTGMKKSVESDYILSNRISQQLVNTSSYVVPATLVKSISTSISFNFHRKQLATVPGESNVSAAAVSLVRNLSSKISTDFATKDSLSDFLNKSQVVSFAGSGRGLATSQSFITDISNSLSTAIDEVFAPPMPYTDGNVYYLTPDGLGRSQPLLNQNVFVCEDQNDIDITIRAGLNLKNVFEQWNRGGMYNDFYYERDSNYPRPIHDDENGQYLDKLLRVYGIEKNDILSADSDKLTGLLQKKIPYQDFKTEYPRITYKVDLKDAPISHAITVNNYVCLNMFNSGDISDVLPNTYRQTSGTCLYHLSSPSGVLYEDYFISKKTMDKLYTDAKCSAILTEEYNPEKRVEYPPEKDVEIWRDDRGFPFWFYNTTLETIVQIVNTDDFSYFFSNQEYDTYDITFKASALSGDDDIISFIAAYNKTGGQEGYPMALSFSRSPNYSNTKMTMWHWKLNVQNPWKENGELVISTDHLGAYLSNVPKYVMDNYKVLSTQTTESKDVTEISARANRYLASYISSYNAADGGSIPEEFDSGKKWHYEPGGAWGSTRLSQGVLIRVKRVKNCISAWTTEFGQNPVTENLGHMISIDLNSTGTNPWDFDLGKLSCFLGPHSIGFGMISQPSTKYAIEKFNIPLTIVNTQNNDLSTYDGNQWARITDTTPTKYVGPGRLSRNPYTGKLFYVQPTGFVKLYQP